MKHLSVTYSVTNRDLGRFATAHTWRHTRRGLWLLLLFLMLAVLGAVDAYLHTSPGYDPLLSALLAFAIYLPLALAGLAIALWLNRWTVCWRSRAAGVLGQQTVRIAPEGLFSEKADVGESRRLWASVDRIVQDREFVLIYLNRINALAIPKRAFANPAAAEEFFQAAHSWHAAAVAEKHGSAARYIEVQPSEALPDKPEA